MVATNIFQAFERSESVVLVSVDIKGTFYFVLPAVLFDQLCAMGLPREIHNYIIFITTRRDTFFSADGAQPRPCSVGLRHELISPSDSLQELSSFIVRVGLSPVRLCE